jgi:hypothetical protein
MRVKQFRCVAAAGVLASILVQSAVAAPTNTFIFGIGRKSCANWLSNTEGESEGQTWILGYWSGANIFDASSHFAGANSDAYAIWREVKKICLSEPSTVFDAIGRVRKQFVASRK